MRKKKRDYKRNMTENVKNQKKKSKNGMKCTQHYKRKFNNLSYKYKKKRML